MCAYPLRCIPRLAVSEVHAVMLFSILGGVFLSVLPGTAPAEFASEGCWLVSRQRERRWGSGSGQEEQAWGMETAVSAVPCSCTLSA